MERAERLSLHSADGVQLNLDALYQIAPSCFTEATDPKTGKIKRVVNFDVLRQLLGDDMVEDAPEAYEFNWVGKQAARTEVLRPINKTLRPVKEDSVDWDTTQNLYIEGDNLEVLKLLQKSYLGKVKMIYIDPPYNTGNDFVYHDDSSRSQEEEDLAAGNIDELGNRYRKNTDSNGRFHSEWCSMIYARLMVARSLLTKDGVMFISISDRELDNLGKMCNEIFGENNFLAKLVWANKEGGGGSDSKHFRIKHEYILAYAKEIDSCGIHGVEIENEDRYKKSDEYVETRGKYYLQQLSMGSLGYIESLDFPIEAPDGTLVFPNKDNQKVNRWRWGKEKVEWGLKNGYIEFTKDREGNWNVNTKQYLKADNEGNIIDRTNRPFALIEKYSSTGASKQLQELLNGRIFDYSKPVDLIKFLIQTGTDKDSIILDFFSGSATTAHAVIKYNYEDNGCRKFILVQLHETIESGSEAYKAGYKNICEIGKERIRRAGKKIKEESPLTTQDLDTGFRVFRVDSSNYEEVEHTPKDWNQDQLDLFLNNIKSDRTDLDLLFGCMLDWGVQLSLPMTTEEVDGKNIYTVNEGDLVACFADKVTDNVVRAMAEKQPLRVIFRDSCFEQDADKINIYETFKQLLDWSDKDVEKNIRVI